MRLNPIALTHEGAQEAPLSFPKNTLLLQTPFSFPACSLISGCVLVHSDPQSDTHHPTSCTGLTCNPQLHYSTPYFWLGCWPHLTLAESFLDPRTLEVGVRKNQSLQPVTIYLNEEPGHCGTPSPTSQAEQVFWEGYMKRGWRNQNVKM